MFSPLFLWFHCGNRGIVVPFLKLPCEPVWLCPLLGLTPLGSAFPLLFFHHLAVCTCWTQSSAPLNFLPLELLLLQLCPLCDDSRITTSRPLSLRLCSQIAFKINKKRVATRVAGMQVGTLSLAQLHDEATPRNQVSSLNTRLLMEGAEVMQALGLAVSAGAFTGGGSSHSHWPGPFVPPPSRCFAWAQGGPWGSLPWRPTRAWPRECSDRQRALPQNLVGSNSVPNPGLWFLDFP